MFKRFFIGVSGVSATVVFVTMVAFFTSCVTPRKAAEVMDNNPEEAAQYCSDRYPVKVRVDTIWTEIDKTDYETMRYLEEFNRQLQRRLEYLEGLPPQIDSATCEELRRAYISDTKRHKAEISALMARMAAQRDSLLTIINTVEDSARLVACREQAKREIGERDKKLAEATASRDEWKEKARVRRKNFWISVIGNLLLAVAFGFVLGKKINFKSLFNKAK